MNTTHKHSQTKMARVEEKDAMQCNAMEGHKQDKFHASLHLFVCVKVHKWGETLINLSVSEGILKLR